MGDFPWTEFVMSPGFGGLAAVVAATIAYVGVHKTVKSRRAADRKAQWWDRARWALDLTLYDGSEHREVGYSVLEALGQSEYAAEHETDLIDAALDRTLDAYAAQDEADEPGSSPEAEAQWTPEDDDGADS
ncbi:hypothetical protein [Aeromicrobium sp. CTD01-1L150]|uniref:hypothetical protein n=1 Tax=Aeromicrobium sp. CTD01-1L150 TaxID=3341830 RepID=UPI0035BF8E8D